MARKNESSQRLMTPSADPNRADSPSLPETPSPLAGGRIVVVMSGDDEDRTLLQHAAVLAGGFDMQTVELLHVYEDPFVPPQLQTDGVSRPSHEDLTQRMLDLYSAQPGWPSSATVRTQLVKGPWVYTVLRHLRAEQADLVCVGHAAGDQQPGLGARARGLCRKSPCSVLAVPLEQPAQYHRLLVPIDFSEPSLEALKAALHLANARQEQGKDCQVIPEHVIDVPARFDVAGCSFEDFAASLQQNSQQHWEQIQQDLPQAAQLPLRIDLIPHQDRSHDIAHRIAWAVETTQSDLIVCGSRGLSGLASFLLGSTVEGLLTLTKQPLLCVKRKGETHGLLDALFNA